MIPKIVEDRSSKLIVFSMFLLETEHRLNKNWFACSGRDRYLKCCLFILSDV